MQKKSKFLTGCLLSIASVCALASGSEIEVGYKSTDYTGGFSNGSSQFVSYKNTQSPKGYWAVSLNQLDLFDHTANIYSAWGSRVINKDVFVSGSFSTSDRGLISHKNRGSVSASYKLPENYIVSGGYEYFNMRNGSHSDGLSVQVVKYVQSMPLVVQGAYVYRVNHPGTHSANTYTLAGTYGHEKDWTVTAGLAYGEANYETTTVIPAFADYGVNRQFVQVRKWVASDWGFSVQADMSQTKFFDRNELGASVFYSF